LSIVGILLAAGRGARFGGDKLSAPLRGSFDDVAHGTPIGVATCRHLVQAIPQVTAVVRPEDVALARLLRDTGANVIACPRAHEGMGASLSCGVSAVADAHGWVVMLADMPWVRPSTIALIAEALAAGADIAAPSFQGQRGHPVGFARRHFAALSALQGDEGARSVVATHANAVTLVEIDDPGVLRDIDTPDQA